MTDTIYVVDDNEINLKIVSAALQAVGYAVATAQNAAEALSNIEEVHPVLAILDVMMPDMDGYELCRQLRARPETSQIPIIILTTLSELDERLKAFEAGADDFIAKPFNPQELQARVKVLLRRLTPQTASAAALQAEVTAVFSLRGGVGVSTVATNLSVFLNRIPAGSQSLVVANAETGHEHSVEIIAGQTVNMGQLQFLVTATPGQ